MHLTGPASGQARVLIADDHPDVAQALTELLRAQSDFLPIGTVDTARDLFEAVTKLRPAIVLIDWELLGFDPRAGVATLRKHADSPQIVAMSAFVLAERAAMAAGADHFISKTDPPESVLAILRTLRGNEIAALGNGGGSDPQDRRPVLPSRKRRPND